MMDGQGVCVIIAAFRAEATIARAVASALAQPEVSEVIVVDDASPDATASAARAADDGSGRLQIFPLTTNAGPSAARNLAIARSSAPLVAILDADDFFLPGRFAAMLATSDWDLLADNILSVDESRVDALDLARIAGGHRVAPQTLSAATFVAGSMTRVDRYKGELAFLKPVMRRAFLDEHALRYDGTLRLAEDYDFYLRALVAGGRFRIAGSCGYVSVDRFGSLSHHHGIDDLLRFEQMIAGHARTSDGDLRRLLSRHRDQTARKRRHRQLLARKHEAGAARAIAEQARYPRGFGLAMADLAGDKLRDAYRRIVPGRETERLPYRFLL